MMAGARQHDRQGRAFGEGGGSVSIAFVPGLRLSYNKYILRPSKADRQATPGPSSGEAHMNDATRSVIRSRSLVPANSFAFSEPPPDADESVVGELDPALAGTYKGLVNIRSVVTLSLFTCLSDLVSRSAKMISWSVLEGSGQSYYTGIVNSVPSLNVP